MNIVTGMQFKVIKNVPGEYVYVGLVYQVTAVKGYQIWLSGKSGSTFVAKRWFDAGYLVVV